MLVEHWEMGFYNKQDPEMCASYNFNFVLLAACFSALPAFLLAILHMGQWRIASLSIRQGGEFKTSQSTTRPCFDGEKRTSVRCEGQ